MDELLEQFLIEGPELVDQATDDLLTLERSPEDAEVLNSAFRAFHTLKGSAGLFDVAPMSALLQVAEDVLADLRAGSAPISKPVIDSLLATAAQCERWLGDLGQTTALGADAEMVSDRLIGALRAQLDQRPAASPPPPPAADWAADLVRLHADRMKGTAVAVRYSPDPQAFFNGDDPLATVRTAPGLLVMTASLREPAQGDYDPFTCNLVFEALCEARLEHVQAAFRLVRDQTSLIEVAAPGAASARAEAARTVRIDIGRVDALADLAGELVVARNGLAAIVGRDAAPALRDAHFAIDRLTTALHRRIMEVRLTPLAPVLRRLRPLGREIAAGLGKDVALVIEDAQTEADRAIADGLFEPLLHILRNAIDHGVEGPQERLAAGKPRQGHIRLSARKASGQVLVEVADDGKGIDPARIRAAALRRGVLNAEAAEALTDAEVVDLVFAPGFSTAETVSDLSGRGVGMDAVRAAVGALGGRVSIRSTPGEGTAITLVLPMTLVLTKVMVVESGGELYGAPLEHIGETVHVPRNAVLPVRHGEAFLLRDEPIPLLHLSQLLGGAPTHGAADLKVLVIEAGGVRVGVAVDRLVDRMDVVARPMSGLLAGAPGVTGTTVMGDGQVLLILDLPELMR